MSRHSDGSSVVNHPAIAAFRVNAGPEIGGGHLVRCLALADELDRCGWQCVFVVNHEAVDTVSTLARRPYLCVTSCDPKDPGVDHLPNLRPGQIDLAVLDGYAFTASTEHRWRSAAERILVIDDLANREHICDVLLDQTLGRVAADYDGLVPDGCRLLLGSCYALIRPEFGRARRQSLKRLAESPHRRVLVSAGATDHDNATALVLRGLADVACDSIEVIIGSACPHLDSIVQKGTELGARISVSPEDMTEPMLRADLAIGAAGTTSWERCCLGLPTILLVVADNQSLIAEQLTCQEAAINLGNLADISFRRIADASAALLDDPSRLQDMSHAAASICDGLGVARVGLVLDPEQTGNGDAVHIRPARDDDVHRLYEWQREPGARQFARVSETPTWKEHCAWFLGKLEDPACILSIVEHDSRPVGVVRLDGTGEVSISIESAARNKGIGLAALHALRRLTMGNVKLAATIHGANLASLKMFERAGYKVVECGGPFWRLELDDSELMIVHAS